MNRITSNDAKLGIWHILEKEEFFLSELDLSKNEIQLFKEIKGKRRLEWLSSRYLVHLMSRRGNRAEILKDAHGKPFIQDSDHFISFSHSHGLSAAIASKNRVGIDIQQLVSKINRIAHKFVNDYENEQLNDPSISISDRLILLHVIWGAKESMYKAYGQRSVDFKKNMTVQSLQWKNNILRFSGELMKADFQFSFKLVAEKIHNHILVYAEEF